MRVIVLLFISAMIFFSACSEDTNRGKKVNSFDTNLSFKLDSVGNTILNQDQVLGFSVAIMHGKDTIYNNGFGFSDIEKKDPITIQTRFLMASISKLIGSTVVMKLVEEGKVRLDQTLIELLPDFPNPVQGRKITLRQMISHTSGLQDYSTVIDSAFVKTGIAPTKSDFYSFFEDRDLQFEPGTNYNYCNSGFLLMGMIVEKVTRNTFQDEVDRVINTPCGTNLKLIEEASSYPEMSKYFELRDSIYLPYPHWRWIKGDGGLTATAIELAHFPRKWANGIIISTESFAEMSNPLLLSDQIQTGYGLGVRNGNFLGRKIIGHTGGHKSTYAIMVYFPKDNYTFVVFMNTDNSSTSVREIFAEFARITLNESIPNPDSIAITTNDLSKYLGNYITHDYKSPNNVSIEIKSGGLYYCYGTECEPMRYIGDNRFWISRWPYDYVEFHVDENNQAIALKEFYTGYYAILRKKTEFKIRTKVANK